jgi:hypothetical protein
MSKRKEKKKRKRGGERGTREKPVGEYSDCLEKIEKFSVTDYEESHLELHVYMFAFLARHRKPKNTIRFS